MEQEDNVNNVVEYEDRHTQTHTMHNLEDATKVPDIVDKSILMPTDVHSKMLEFFTNINKLTEEYIRDNYTKEEKLSTISTIGSLDTTLKDDVYIDRLKDSTSFVNEVKYGEKVIGTKKLSFKTDDTSNLSQSAAVARFRSLMAVGELIQVPLWHSGFWVTITPPSLKELVNLEISLANAEINLGRDTSSLVYTNYHVVTYRIVSEFIVKHIHESTLKLEDNDDIRKYILLPDFMLLVNGICSSMYPDGYNIVKTCKNSMVLLENNKPKCDFRLEAVIDPKKLLFVDRKLLTNKMLEHMSNRVPDTVTIDGVKDYQLGLKPLLDKHIAIPTEAGNEIDVLLSMPTLLHYITVGERWVDGVIKDTEETFTDSDTVESKLHKLNNILSSCLLGTFNSFVKSINKDIIEYEHILESLSIMSVDDVAYDKLTKEIKNYINQAVIAIIATPSYDCPKCKEPHNEVINESFKDLIPLNVIEHFFGLSTLRMNKTKTRLT